MNEFFNGPRGAQFDAMYYWDQFHPILAAIVILLVGWIIALLVAAGVKKTSAKIKYKCQIIFSYRTYSQHRRPRLQSRILVYSDSCCCCRFKCAQH